MDPSNKLTVRLFEPRDMALISEWLEAHRGRHTQPPPWIEKALGVVVMDECGPACALFAMECFRVPFCFLDYPIARPGMGWHTSVERFRFAVSSLIQLAGKCCEPQAVFTEFVCYASPPMSRILEGMGFQEETPVPQKIMRLTIPPPPPPIPAPSDSSGA